MYDVETNTINYHLKKVFADSELEEIARNHAESEFEKYRTLQDTVYKLRPRGYALVGGNYLSATRY